MTTTSTNMQSGPARKPIRTAIKLGAATAGAGAMLAGSHVAEAALYPPVKVESDIVMNMVTKSAATGSVTAQGSNSADDLISVAAAYTSQGHLGVSSRVTNEGLSMYAKGYVRCRNVANGSLISAAYVPGVSQTSTTQYTYCSQLPGGVNAWTRIGWGTTIVTATDAIPKHTNRKICAGLGNGAVHPATNVSTEYVTFYPYWTSTVVAVASPDCPGSSNPCTNCSW